MSNESEIVDAAAEALRVLRKVADSTTKDVAEIGWAIRRQERGAGAGEELGEGGKEVYGALDQLDSRLKRAAGLA